MEEKKRLHEEKFNKLAKELEVYAVKKTTRKDGTDELDIPLHTTVLVVRPGNRFRKEPRTNYFIGNFIGTECEKKRGGGYNCDVKFDNILMPTFEEQSAFIEDNQLDEEPKGDASKYQKKMASWSINNQYLLYYGSKPFQAIAELSQAQLKDPSGKPLPAIPLELQSKFASYFKPEGKEPEGVPETYTTEAQKEARSVYAPGAGTGQKPGGRRKTKKSRKNRRMTRRR